MFKTFAAALIAVNALGVKVQTGSQVHAGAEVLQTPTCEASLTEFLNKFQTTNEDDEAKRTLTSDWWSYKNGTTTKVVTFAKIYTGT